MVPHQGVGVDPPTRPPARLAQGVEEYAVIARVPEDRLLAVPPAHHVVQRSRELYAWRPAHGPTYAGKQGRWQ